MFNLSRHKLTFKKILQKFSLRSPSFINQYFKFNFSTTFISNDRHQNNQSPTNEFLNLLNNNLTKQTSELENVDLNLLSKDCLKNMLHKLDYFQVDSVNKLLYYLPEETDKIILEYLNKNSFENAMKIFKFHKNISIKTLKKIEQIFHKRFLNYKLNQYIKKEIQFYQFFEFVIFDDKLSISFCIERLCRHNFIEESLAILSYLNFDETVQLKPVYLNKIINYQKTNSKRFLIPPQKNPFKFLKENNMLPEEDSFGPHNEECLKLELDEQRIKIINSMDDLHHLNLFTHSKVVGIDCEWKPNSNSGGEESKISLMQIADSEHVLLIDMLILGSENLFIDKFCEIFKSKSFVSFAFHNDFDKMNINFQKFFEREKENLIDLSTKSREGNRSLSKLVNEVLKKSLCKKEQCSNWEMRPLRAKQIHYAALDAYVLVKLNDEL